VLSDPMPHFAKWVASPTNVDGETSQTPNGAEHLQNKIGIDLESQEL
jgi:hypothetical protein